MITRLNVRDNRRRIVSLSVLLASSIVAAGSIYSLPSYQRNSLKAAANEKLDAISVAYLRVMLRTYPDDSGIRLSLVHALIEIGKYQEARETLLPMVREAGPNGTQARLALLDLDRAVLRESGLLPAQRKRIAASLGYQIADMLAVQSSPPVLVHLNQASRELGRSDLVVRSLELLVKADTAQRPQWLDQTARVWLEQGQPSRAATAYRDIAMLANAPSTLRRRYAVRALDTYFAANDGAHALAFAGVAPAEVRNDPGFLDRAIRVAQSQDNAGRAASFGRELLALTPESAAALEKQLDLELAAGALPAALQLAQRIVAVAPGVPSRTRLATIADWNSAQEIAFREWTALARQDPAGPAMTRALELARARAQDEVWLDLMSQASTRRVVSAEELHYLLALAQRQPQARKLQAVLEAVVARQPGELGLWVTLSDIQQQAGNGAGAMATLRKIPASLAGPVDRARLEASLLARTGGKAAGLERLMAARAAAAPSDSRYWTLLGDLAYDTGERDAALTAYRAAWDAQAGEAQLAERLIALYNGTGGHAAAVEVAREADRRFDEPRWLILAMDAAVQGQRWEDLRVGLATAAARPAHFETSDRYWLLAALLASHDGRKAEARQAYRRALLLKPASTEARIGWMWLEIDGGEQPILRKMVADWSGDAAADADYWGPFAAAMMRLGRPADALPWFERQLQVRPGDAAWSLEYAEALARAGRENEAVGVRRLAYLQLKPRIERDAPLPAVPASLMLSYANLVREFEGDTPAQAILIRLIQLGRDPSTAQARLVDSLLAQKKYDQARAWLQRADAEQRTMPAWQYLSVAQASNDRRQIAALLKERAADLSVPDQVAALRKLGRNGEALALAEANGHDPALAGNTDLVDAIGQLRWQQSRRGTVLLESQQLGHLDLRKWELGASTPLTLGRTGIRLARTRLEADDSALRARPFNEEELSVSLARPLGDGEVSMTVGANRHPDDTLLQGELAWTRPLTDSVGVRLDAAVNKISEESALMRLLGKKHRLGAGLTLDAGRGRYSRFEIAAQRYDARGGGRFGSGYRIEGELGATVRAQSPQIRLRVSGSHERNDLEEGVIRLPDGVFVPEGWALAGNVVPERFTWAGVGATALFGVQDPAAGQAHGAIDAVVGRQWPDQRSAYGIRARLVLPLGSRSELQFDAVHSNVQRTVAAPAIRRLQFSYVHRF